MAKRLVISMALVSAILFGAPVAVCAADDSPLTLAMIQENRQNIVLKNLDLTEAENSAFLPLYIDYRAEQEKLDLRTATVVEKYRTTYKNVSEEDAESLLEEALAIRADRVKMQKSFVKPFREVLGSKKLALFYQIENKLDAVVACEMADKIPLIR